MSNKYTSSSSTIVAGDSCMYNEATTSKYNLTPKQGFSNTNTYQIIGHPTKISKKSIKNRHKK